MLNSLKVKELSQDLQQSIKSIEEQLIDVVNAMSNGFRIGIDKDTYVAKKRINGKREK